MWLLWLPCLLPSNQFCFFMPATSHQKHSKLLYIIQLNFNLWHGLVAPPNGGWLCVSVSVFGVFSLNCCCDNRYH